MKEGVFFHDDSIINWIGVILSSLMILAGIWFPLWILYLKSRPERKKKYYLNSEWKNVPYHVGTFIVVGLFCAYGFWWEATRIDSAEYKRNNTIIFRGFFGNELARFPVSEITDVSSERREHLTNSGYGSTYKVFITVGKKEFVTRPLSSTQEYLLVQDLEWILPKKKK